MSQSNEPNQDAIADTDPGLECPLCKDEVDGPLEDHLVARHAHEELATLVAKYVYERVETGSIL